MFEQDHIFLAVNDKGATYSGWWVVCGECEYVYRVQTECGQASIDTDTGLYPLITHWSGLTVSISTTCDDAQGGVPCMYTAGTAVYTK